MAQPRAALICPTAFKGTLSASEAADALAEGAGRAAPDLDLIPLPLSDGGNGLLDALAAADPAGARFRTVRVAGPVGDPVPARYLHREGDAPLVAVETAEACGLHLVEPRRRDPLRTDTRGVGELLLAAAGSPPPAGEAARSGPLVVGLGGSATVDAGAGMASALGWLLLDDEGRPLGPGGGALPRLARIEPPTAPPQGLDDLTVLADVTNPLLGPHGAAPVFGPQKGADAAAVAVLERGLERWARVVERDLGVSVDALEGGGAAGGLGAAFAAFLRAPPVRGAAWVLDAVGFDALLARAAIVVTGEGAWDAQSAMGKVTGVVVERARAADVPVVVVAGLVDGTLPPGVTAAVGDGAMLDPRALAELTERAVRGLLARRAAP